MILSPLTLQIWWGWRRHGLSMRRARLLRRLAFRAYSLAGEVGEWARETFVRTAWVDRDGVGEEWRFPIPAAEEPVRQDLCGACGRPLGES